ncbi:RNA polymerase Rpb1, domain 3 [Dillenia turbinata]|uniref:DNA-directed RNA polymerase subunit n=1 Tax=Dillenia turbinata TaxID=194707 RepID=A0AAN8V8N0_9MAGN
MEVNPMSMTFNGEIVGIRFGLATRLEIDTASISNFPISHASQLSNPFLGLPLESGRCESCGTAEPGQCEGHFGYIQLPIPIYHPCHIGELKRMLNLLCLKCLKLRTRKAKATNMIERALNASPICCEEVSQISVREAKTTDGAWYLELKLPSKFRLPIGFWNFLEKYGFRYGDDYCRTLLPSEVSEMLRKMPEDTKRKLAGKGYFPQEGYILHYLPVPPNCLSVPDVSDGIRVMSSDISVSMLKKVLKQVEIIKSSRSGTPNFESHEVEANDLQAAVGQYLYFRGAAKGPHDMDSRFGISKEPGNASTKAWVDKMKTLFISKGSGCSSRSVLTGDSYKEVNEIGIPSEIAQRITVEEIVNVHNLKYLQELVDSKLCLTYKDGLSLYSLREGSKGHTFLRPGQVVYRRIMDGDMVIINRPPTTHKHSLQALTVYVHDDHTVKINPLICGPLGADFDGDCVPLFYPQSLAAKAEVLELFSVDKQLISSHTGSLNLQLGTDAILSLKMLFRKYFMDKAAVQQLAMFVPTLLSQPALVKTSAGPLWTALQILETALPTSFNCCGDRHLIMNGHILKIEFNRDVISSLVNDIVSSILFEKGSSEALKFFNSIQPLLMENLFSEGFSIGLEDIFLSKAIMSDVQRNIQDNSVLLFHLRSTYNEQIELQLENSLRMLKVPVVNFILKASGLGNLIDSKSDSALNKIVQQVGFLGLQLSDKGKFYSRTLVDGIASLFKSKYKFEADYPSAEFGLIRSCFVHGLDPYEEVVHSISSREVLIRSSKGLSEPGTLFKNLMAILRDVVICYDGTVRNLCSNSIIQFEYELKSGAKPKCFLPAGEPVGVLAATSISNPAYKAVLDSSSSSNSSWELMKYCQENSAFRIVNHLEKVNLRKVAVELMIEYRNREALSETPESVTGLVGHIHLNMELLRKYNRSMHEVLQRCQETVQSFKKKKIVGQLLKNIALSVSECCSFKHSCERKSFGVPCLKFFWKDASDDHLEKISHILTDKICPILLETVIKGDPRVYSVNIIWTSPDTTTWIRNPSKSQKGELALDIVLEKSAVKRRGDAWRIVLDSCLPVIHLIDTRSSIPYAIKEVQELLGISCAFDQAVQRLSTSVTMVAKGLLKEHLILLGNSMTCSGNLVGFTKGGYKALSQSLKLQVPFTEATQFTPKKCFERAAEKMHLDSLSSIVASCSWGKHVALGTGSRFDLLWDTKEINGDQVGDVYSFLHLVRGTMNEAADTSCIGAEIENLEPEDENLDGLSPEHDSSLNKPVFEDDETLGIQLQDIGGVSELGWGQVASRKDSSGGGGWDIGKFNNQESGTLNSNPSGWCTWGTAKAQKQEASKISGASKWGQGAVQKDSSLNKPAFENDETLGIRLQDIGKASESSWGQVVSRKDSSGDGEWNADKFNNRGCGTSSSDIGGWSALGSGKAHKSNNEPATKEAFADSDCWNSAPMQQERSIDSDGWNQTITEPEKSWEQAAIKEAFTYSDGWNSAPVQKERSIDRDGRNQTIKAPERAWERAATKEAFTSSDGWNGAPLQKESTDRDGWNQTIKEPEKAWKQNATKEAFPYSDGWNSAAVQRERSIDRDGWNQNVKEPEKAWEQAGNALDLAKSSQSGREKVASRKHSSSSGGWGFEKVDNQGSSDGDGWNQTVEEPEKAWEQTGNALNFGESSQLDWKKVASKKHSSSSGGWGIGKVDNQGSGDRDGWNRSEKPNQGGWDDNGKSGGRARRANPDWKSKKMHPPRSPAMFNDDSNIGIYTATRQRKDMFTSEEQPVLSDIEPVMHSIRRIMQQSSYNDGDKLSADDQSFVLENVFNYHPDKGVKMGAGVDYVMISKHTSFQDSRCFYIVSTDGHKEDFSYRKCLENFIRGKYPDVAETFIEKYWSRKRKAERDAAVAPSPSMGTS